MAVEPSSLALRHHNTLASIACERAVGPRAGGSLFRACHRSLALRILSEPQTAGALDARNPGTRAPAEANGRARAPDDARLRCLRRRVVACQEARCPTQEKVERVAELKAADRRIRRPAAHRVPRPQRGRDHRAPPFPRRGRHEVPGGQEHPDAAGRERRRRRGARGPAGGPVRGGVRRRRPRGGGQVGRRRPRRSSPPWRSRAGTWTARCSRPTRRRRSPSSSRARRCCRRSPA